MRLQSPLGWSQMTLYKPRLRLVSYSVILDPPTGALQPLRNPHLPSYPYEEVENLKTIWYIQILYTLSDINLPFLVWGGVPALTDKL